MTPRSRDILVLILFSIAMAALESAVVVYLRALYYPEGFTVVFRLIDVNVLTVELIREAATLIMLGAVAYLAFKNTYDRFAAFLLSFAVWDLFYYCWLRIFIGWPSSFLDWDILFLLPVTWLGPVLAPVICSYTMILFSGVLFKHRDRIQVMPIAKGLIAMGCVLILWTFVSDHTTLLINNDLMRDYFQLLQNKKFIALASSYLPKAYNWILFAFGELLICLGIFRIYSSTRVRGVSSHPTPTPNLFRPVR